MDRPLQTLLYELVLEPILQSFAAGARFRFLGGDRYRSSSTPISSSPQTLTYCAFPIVPGPFGPIS